ncbi:MAG TPA: DinB family protein [Terriglobales bacterium]|nr:DinB family protein [Terriglobales bacterium]
MKALHCITACALALAVTPLAAAAQAANPVTTAVKNSLRGATHNMVAAAQEMPADKYGFKPTPQSMSFGQLVLHVATSNTMTCQWISGAAAAPKTALTPTSPKDQLVDLLQSSFTYCTQALASVDDSKLGSPVSWYGRRQVTQAAALLGLADDWADHYSQQAAYLRLNGLLPPTAQRRGMPGMKKMGKSR